MLKVYSVFCCHCKSLISSAHFNLINVIDVLLSYFGNDLLTELLQLPTFSAGLIIIVSSFLNFGSSFCSILDRFRVDIVSVFSRFKLFITLLDVNIYPCFEVR